ncbi:MAG TPA: hypothetical protein VFX45_11000 [Solirubrobacterales bacterium]|nr:hypothetical protein [Solirubrobacterales bacterium]
MRALSRKLTYANVMSTLAVFLVLGGATAVAAGQLGKNSVGSKQLRKNAVTAAKLKTGAVTESKLAAGAVTATKIKDGAITGAKVDAATLGTVPRATSAASAATAATASTFAGYARKGVIRVTAAPERGSIAESFAAAPETPIVTVGPFTVYGKCVEFGGIETDAVIFIRTTENGSLLNSDFDDFEGNPLFLDANTPETNRELTSTGATGNAADYFAVHSPEFTAIAPSGVTVRGDLQVAAKHGNLANGNGLYGDDNVCLFAGEATALNG